MLGNCRISAPGRGTVAVLVILAFLLSGFITMANAGVAEAQGEGATNLSEYYQAWGKSLPSLSTRAGIYQALGLGSSSSYSGTAAQNTTLLNALKSRQIAPMSAAELSSTPSSSTTYTIQRGDTLSGIAARYGTTVSALMNANPQITDPNVIYAGQTLNIPSSTPTPNPTPQPTPQPTPEPQPEPTPEPEQVQSKQYTLKIEVAGSGSTYPSEGV